MKESEGPPFPVPGLPSDVVVLPDHVEGGVGVYGDETLTLVKELRAEGIDASYLHDAEHREWYGVKGEVVVPLILAFTLNFLASGAWDSFKALFRRYFGRQKLSVRFGHQRAPDGSELAWFEASGDPDAILEAIDRVKGDAVERGGP